MGVIESMSRQFVHGNLDDRLDLGVVFPAEATRQLMARVDEDGTSPVALRYQTENGAGYLLGALRLRSEARGNHDCGPGGST